jgi:hemerythrin-like domain-containing protein
MWHRQHSDVSASDGGAAMAVDAFEMALVHAAFRRELAGAPSLIHNVEAGDTRRSSTVGGHVAFMAEALHHHHAAEDAVIWPKLRARAATSEVDVTRMEDAHREIADYIERVRTVAMSWSASADPRVADQLATTLEEFGARLDEHLADEERNVVPLINNHLTLREWRRFLARGGRFLFKHPRLGLVLAGFVLDPLSAGDRQCFLANVPPPQRMAFQLFGMRIYAAYRAKLYGSPVST